MSIYCEPGIGIFLTQPINTFSNVAFLLAAYFSYQILKKEGAKNKPLRLLPWVSAFIGLGSSLWHGIPHPVSDFLDIFSIGLFATLVVFYLLYFLLEKTTAALSVIVVMFLMESPFLFDILPSFNGFLPYMILLIFSVGLAVFIAKKQPFLWKPFGSVLLIFIFSLTLRTLDLSLCPWIPFGTHFLWHILNAAMTYFIVKLLVRIEKVRGSNLIGGNFNCKTNDTRETK